MGLLQLVMQIYLTKTSTTCTITICPVKTLLLCLKGCTFKFVLFPCQAKQEMKTSIYGVKELFQGIDIDNVFNG